VLTPETLDRLDSQTAMRIGLDISTPVAVDPGVLRQLIACYRQHVLAPIDPVVTPDDAATA
jgi:hypothetical protein